MLKLTTALAGMALLLSITGCGTSTGERALSGGAIGAGAGAGVGAVTDMNMSTGALIGAGIGAVGGALTGPRDTRQGD